MNDVQLLEIAKRLKQLRKQLKATAAIPHQVDFMEDINNTLKEVSVKLTQITASIDNTIVDNQALLKASLKTEETNPWLAFRVSRAKVIEHTKMRVNDVASVKSTAEYTKESLMVYTTSRPPTGSEGISLVDIAPVAHIVFGDYVALISHPIKDLFYKRVENGYVTLETGSLEKEELLNILTLFKKRVDRLELPA